MPRALTCSTAALRSSTANSMPLAGWNGMTSPGFHNPNVEPSDSSYSAPAPFG